MLILILTPFLLYILAEDLGLSGILAAVAGGIVHAIEKDHARSEVIELRVVSENTWSVILFVLSREHPLPIRTFVWYNQYYIISIHDVSLDGFSRNRSSKGRVHDTGT